VNPHTHLRAGRSTRLLIGAVALLLLSACNHPSHGLSEKSGCSAWNNADINAQGTYVQTEIKAMSGLNRWTGYADGEISRYCSNDPTANLGDMTHKVATEP
jgi:hypothetical protein